MFDPKTFTMFEEVYGVTVTLIHKGIYFDTAAYRRVDEVKSPIFARLPKGLVCVGVKLPGSNKLSTSVTGLDVYAVHVASDCGYKVESQIGGCPLLVAA